MRSIKFRAFINGEMIYDLAYEEYAPINDLLEGTDNLMQFTGLFDKQGVEIYEGDILQTSNTTDENFDIWQPSEHGYTVVESKETLGYTFSNWHIEEDYEAVESVFCFTFVEVVGNIYENQELLKDKQ